MSSLSSSTSAAKHQEALAEFSVVAEHPSLEGWDALWLGIKTDPILVDLGNGVIAEEPFYTGWQTTNLKKKTKVFSAYIEAGFTPFPSWVLDYEEIVLVEYLTPKKLEAIQWAAEEKGIHMSFARWNNATNALEGKENTYKKLPAWVDGAHKKVLFIGKSSYNGGENDCWNEGKISVRHLVENLSKLDDAGKAKFLVGFGGFMEGDVPELVHLKPHAANNLAYATAQFNLAEKSITTGRKFQVRGMAYMSRVGVIDSGTAMVLLGLQLAGLSSGVGQSAIDGVISELTQLWEEEDLYGQQMDRNQQLRTIRNNTCCIFEVEDRDSFPNFKLINNNNRKGVLECCDYFYSQRIPFITDKNALKRVTYGAGVYALWCAMDFDNDLLLTPNDIKKIGKLLNRGPNSVAIAASEGILGLGELSKGWREYVENALQIHYINEEGEEENIRVLGDRSLTLTHDGRIITNGSGVGLTSRHFAYSATKTIRSTYNALSLKAGETLAGVKAEMEMKLAALLDKEEIIPHDAKNKVLFNFRGQDLLEYRGLNQDILVSIKNGCSFQVKALTTSNSISVSLTVVYVASDMEIKYRGLGIKAVLKDGTLVQIRNAEGKLVWWDVALNSECLKGNAARLAQYAEAMKDLTGCNTYIHIKEGLLHTPTLEKDADGNTVYIWQDLGDFNAPIYQWWAENTKIYYIQDWVEYDIYFQTLILGHAHMSDRMGDVTAVEEALKLPMNDDIQLINPATGLPTDKVSEAMNPEKTGVLVQERVRGVLANYVGQVEMATVRECSVLKQAPTLEMASAVYASNPDLGESLLKGSVDRENAICGFAAMVLNDPSLLGLDGLE